MAKQNRAAKIQPDKKSRAKVKPTAVEERSDDLAGLAKLPGGPIAVMGGSTIQAQAAQLGDPRWQSAQRQALAAQIGRVQGNRHLQRVVASVRGETKTAPYQSHTSKPSTGSASGTVMKRSTGRVHPPTSKKPTAVNSGSLQLRGATIIQLGPPEERTARMARERRQRFGRSREQAIEGIRPVSTLGEYIGLVRRAEREVGESPRHMLSLLRQIYYGTELWSASRSEHWATVIPSGVSISYNPRERLGNTLFEALQNSQVVGGVDIGHVFAGLEAMMGPLRRVTLVPQVLVVQMPNEEFASWGGDLGSVAAQRVYDEGRGESLNWPDDYFGGGTLPAESTASYEDMRGNIDSYVIQRGLTRTERLGPGRPQRIESINNPVSQILSDYYQVPSTPGVTQRDRFPSFVRAIGGQISDGRITEESKSFLVRSISPRVRSFARAFYVNLAHRPPIAVESQLETYSEEITSRFVDWLDEMLRA